ncbi:hypothetical protein [Superficieibacter sp. 1612_C1]|nr:hypothetical protein [Superficieibacter sp. 1612_C1]
MQKVNATSLLPVAADNALTASVYTASRDTNHVSVRAGQAPALTLLY